MIMSRRPSCVLCQTFLRTSKQLCRPPVSSNRLCTGFLANFPFWQVCMGSTLFKIFTKIFSISVCFDVAEGAVPTVQTVCTFHIIVQLGLDAQASFKKQKTEDVRQCIASRSMQP